MNEDFVKEAGKYLDPVDFVMDLYDMKYIWASKTLLDDLGYSMEEFLEIRSVDILDKSIAEEDYRNKITECLSKPHGTTSVTLVCKSGKKIKSEAEYHVFKFNIGYYMAGKGIKSEYI